MLLSELRREEGYSAARKPMMPSRNGCTRNSGSTSPARSRKENG